MISATSYESLVQQIESLREELGQCHKALELSQDNEFKYQRVLESLSEGFMLLDCDQTITEVNQALMKISGYSRWDLIGQPIGKFYDKAMFHIKQTCKDSIGITGSYNIIYNSDTIRWAQNLI
jgi:PAS domain-containing protein